MPLICAYCGQHIEKTTRDHVVPNALWPKGRRPSHPVIVPACAECHTSGDRETAYFRDTLILMADPDKHPLLEEMAKGPVSRSVHRNRPLKNELMEKAELVWETSESGIIVEPSYRVPFDSARFCQSVEKIVRGLFFHKSRVPLPQSHEVKVFPGNGFWSQDAFQDLLNAMEPFSGMGDDVFQCRCVGAPNDLARTVWLLVFYRSITILVRTSKRDSEAESE